MDPITNAEDYFYHLGKFYFQKEDYIRAVKELEKGLKINEDSAVILYELGICYIKLEEYRKAVSYFDKVQSIAPKSISARNAENKVAELKCKNRSRAFDY